LGPKNMRWIHLNTPTSSNITYITTSQTNQQAGQSDCLFTT
jgi:hypothetical protein